MGKISKGFGSAIAVLGILCLIFGIYISVISWVMVGKTPISITPYENKHRINSFSIYSYRLGGLCVIIE